MATSSIDELNVLQSEGEEQIDSRKIYEEYFSIMPISDARKELRVELALALEAMFMESLTDMNADRLTDEYIDEEYYTDRLENKYGDLVEKYANNIADDNYMDLYIATMMGLFVENTIKHQDSDYYYSQQRAIVNAKNQSNQTVNYSEEMESIANGATMKVWVSVGDDKVRPTHREADGQTVSIYEPFQVGDSELMFPTDTSLGAGWAEVDGCRCCAEYINDEGDVVGSEEDIDISEKLPETLDLDDIEFRNSVGAKYNTENILDLKTGECYTFIEGESLKNVQVFAGYGVKSIYRDAQKYADKLGGEVEKWQHVKGEAYVRHIITDEVVKAELHWSQCEGIGKHDFFIKRILDEG